MSASFPTVGGWIEGGLARPDTLRSSVESPGSVPNSVPEVWDAADAGLTLRDACCSFRGGVGACSTDVDGREALPRGPRGSTEPSTASRRVV